MNTEAEGAKNGTLEEELKAIVRELAMSGQEDEKSIITKPLSVINRNNNKRDLGQNTDFSPKSKKNASNIEEQGLNFTKDENYNEVRMPLIASGAQAVTHKVCSWCEKVYYAENTASIFCSECVKYEKQCLLLIQQQKSRQSRLQKSIFASSVNKSPEKRVHMKFPTTKVAKKKHLNEINRNSFPTESKKSLYHVHKGHNVTTAIKSTPTARPQLKKSLDYNEKNSDASINTAVLEGSRKRKRQKSVSSLKSQNTSNRSLSMTGDLQCANSIKHKFNKSRKSYSNYTKKFANCRILIQPSDIVSYAIDDNGELKVVSISDGKEAAVEHTSKGLIAVEQKFEMQYSDTQKFVCSEDIAESSLADNQCSQGDFHSNVLPNRISKESVERHYDVLLLKKHVDFQREPVCKESGKTTEKISMKDKVYNISCPLVNELASPVISEIPLTELESSLKGTKLGCDSSKQNIGAFSRSDSRSATTTSQVKSCDNHPDCAAYVQNHPKSFFENQDYSFTKDSNQTNDNYFMESDTESDTENDTVFHKLENGSLQVTFAESNSSDLAKEQPKCAENEIPCNLGLIISNVRSLSDILSDNEDYISENMSVCNSSAAFVDHSQGAKNSVKLSAIVSPRKSTITEVESGETIVKGTSDDSICLQALKSKPVVLGDVFIEFSGVTSATPRAADELDSLTSSCLKNFRNRQIVVNNVGPVTEVESGETVAKGTSDDSICLQALKSKPVVLGDGFIEFPGVTSATPRAVDELDSLTSSCLKDFRNGQIVINDVSHKLDGCETNMNSLHPSKIISTKHILDINNIMETTCLPISKSKSLSKKISTVFEEVTNSKKSLSKDFCDKVVPEATRIVNIVDQDASRQMLIDKGCFISFNGDVFSIRTVVGDGNCMFRALSVLLLNDEDQHERLRTLTVNYILSKWDWFSQFIIKEIAGTPRTAKKYTENMKRNGIYGGHVELTAIAEIFKVRINNYNKSEFRKKPIPISANASEQVISILYSGEIDNGHYDALLPLSINGHEIPGTEIKNKSKVAKTTEEKLKMRKTHLRKMEVCYAKTTLEETVVQPNDELCPKKSGGLQKQRLKSLENKKQSTKRLKTAGVGMIQMRSEETREQREERLEDDSQKKGRKRSEDASHEHEQWLRKMKEMRKSDASDGSDQVWGRKTDGNHGNFKCLEALCRCCEYLEANRKFTLYSTGVPMWIKSHITCKSTGVIFIIECTKCKEQYFSFSGSSTLEHCVDQIVSDITKRQQRRERSECIYHFLKIGHQDGDLKVYGIEANIADSELALKRKQLINHLSVIEID